MLPLNAMPADSPPSLSVIVVCKNPGPRLAAALQSVWGQRGAAAELVVVDGGSTDGTCAWLEQHRARLAVLISEPDRGVYDAMNKGIAAARGEWVLFLGADDALASDLVLAEAAATLRQTAGGVVVGEVAYTDGRVYRLAAAPRPLARNFVHHQGAFYRRSLFAENGALDATLGVMGDYDFNVRLWQNRVRFKACPLRIADCGPRGLSDGGRWQGYREEIAVRHRYFAAWRSWGWDALSVLRFVRKQLLLGRPFTHG